jgi:hypothetical protein
MSNAVQLRDSSDITTFLKNRAIYQNYVQLESKNQLPIGGISHEHLMSISRANDNFIPMSSILPKVTAISPTGNTVTYSTTSIVATACDPTCASGTYMPETYRNNFYTS